MKNLKLIPGICIILLFSFTHSYSKTYYVSNGGSDSYNGLSDVLAWKTLVHAVASVTDGDSILLRKGDIFREKADFNAAGILNLYIGSYGASAAMPVVSGSSAITGWTLWKDNIYVASSSLDIHYLYVNNQLMTIARYPNKGWLRIASPVYASGSTSMTATGLNKAPRNTAGYWTGGNMRWRRWSWWFETHAITNSDASGKFFISANPGSDNITNWGFYLDNKLSELDTAGEWYHDKAADKVYMYVPSGTNVNDLTVEGSILDVGMTVDSSTVNGICFRHQYSTGLAITGTMKVSNCRFEWIGSDNGGSALSASWDVINAHIHHNYFINNLNNTISWNENAGHGGSSIIEYNTLINCGVVPAYGGNGSWHAAGIVIINGANIHIRNNKIDHVGYAAVIMGKQNNFVENNVIKRAMSTLNDGGAVYTNCSRTTITGNIILDTEGDLESSGPWGNLGHGIWPEFLSEFRESVIENNTVSGGGGYGLFLPNNFDCTIRNNTFYNNKKGQMSLSKTGGTKLIQGHLIENNILFGIGTSQPSLIFDKGLDYGTFQNNFIGNPWNNNETNNSYPTEQLNYLFPWVIDGNHTDSIKIPPYRTWNHSSEMIADPSFDNGTSQWALDAKSKPAVIASATDQPLLNGKCMKISFSPGNIYWNYLPSNSMTAGQYYEMKIDFVCQNLDVSETSAFSSYINISLSDSITHTSLGFYSIPASKKKKTVWLVFFAPKNVTKAELQFSHNSTIANTIWMDNFTLKHVEAQDRFPSNESQLLYNDTTFARKIGVGAGKWHDIYGKTVTDSVLLNPFRSIILIRNETDSIGGIPPATNPAKNEVIHFSNQIVAYPNPVYSALTLENLEGSGEIRIINANGQMLSIQNYYTDAVILNVESLPQGIYYIIVINEKGNYGTAKVLKL